ncbi:hypothetical protein [Pseudothauera rhizosphaerae]|uniref:DUF998 domain-containing protein n=1 Tax=Pseudothauera rhizosphaerae TaxID=2565932 RepID=A0A4S4AYJ0_9RHOO|nr:hypothetical protein [Pseudothauera rhizosphaerae]THF65043.1 hypothetical protein E6O51_00090 [Pseudothauera rhizosphaerae]
MRSFLASVIVLCLLGGAWLLGGPEFFMPARYDPSHGVHFSGLSSRLLGAALLLLAALGLGVARHAGRGSGKPPSPAWQWRYFLLLLASLVLIGTAFHAGEPGPSPHHRSPQ